MRYDRPGGRAAIEVVVGRFCERVFADERLSSAFETADMDRLRAHQRAFIASAIGGPADYEETDMRRAHAGLDISVAEFAAVASHLRGHSRRLTSNQRPSTR